MEHKPYMPSNGTEGMWWTELWCDRCSRRAIDPSAKTQCVHELRAFFGEDNKRWYWIDGVPTCIAFRDRKLKKRYNRPKTDKRQLALFREKEK